MFGTKAFLNDRIISRRPFQVSPGVLSFNVWEENYVRVADQIGGSTTLAAWQDAYFDANLGALFRRGGTNRAGGMIRLVQPLNNRWAFTVEAGLNETLLGAGNTGRLVFGLQLGNWVRPKEFTQVQHAVPVEVPRVRYELLTRKVRTGNAPPVADAGPDQIGVPAGAITLNGSGSFDPDGDPITYQWEQIAGPTVSISGMNTAAATFTAAQGQAYSFRLRVKDSQGAQSTARTSVTTAAPLAVYIVRYTATPAAIRAGQSSVLSWQVQNADTVEITGLGSVDPRAGTSSVSPAQTTTYKLIARNRSSEVSESLTVVVEQPQVRILSFQASPANISLGQSATLIWQTENAETVSISDLGDLAVSGTSPVTPSRDTTYTLIARNRYGEVTATTTVKVTPAPAPRILTFFAAPAQILTGEPSTLVWQVENAAKVEITSLGAVSTAGSREVSPATTTTYTLTASNSSGQVTATATVTVLGPVEITSFTANPTSTNPNKPVTLTWTTKNATSAWISGVGNVAANGSAQVSPAATTTYTLIATGNRTQATAMVTVQVISLSPPLCDAGANLTTSSQNVMLDASGSKDPAGGPLTFSWRVTGAKPAEISGANTATPQVYFQQSYGEYLFEVTVTNSGGQRCTATTRVNYIDP